MSWRFRRSVKIAPGIKLNFSKHGVSTSFGVRGAHVTVGKDHVTRTVGIPGTGIYNTETTRLHEKRNLPCDNGYHPIPLAPLQPVRPVKTAKWYSGYGLTFKILGALLFFMGLLVCIVLLPFGIACMIFGAIMFLLGAKYRRTSKKMRPYDNFEVPAHENALPDDREKNISEEPASPLAETKNASRPVAASETNPYDYFAFDVAGVTFKNGRKYRQTILRKIKFRDDPFQHNVNISIRPYDFEGERAYGVYANDEQIGNVPKEYVPYIDENTDRFDTITGIDIRGGGALPDGSRRNYGARITLRFKKKTVDVQQNSSSNQEHDEKVDEILRLTKLQCDGKISESEYSKRMDDMFGH